jgi:antirestriction protein
MTGDTWDDMRTADTIDTRDIIDRIAEIESTLEGADETAVDAAAEAAELREELDALTTFVSEYDGSFGDSFRDGVTLIADSYFEDYARDLAEDIGALDRKAGWPMDYIDWERAAAALQSDYTSIEIDGTTYWGQ